MDMSAQVCRRFFLLLRWPLQAPVSFTKLLQAQKRMSPEGSIKTHTQPS